MSNSTNTNTTSPNIPNNKSIPEKSKLSNQIIVVGGGLAGLSAAHTIYEHGGNVLVIDKNPFFGGNSTKATSGINGALTNTQISKNINDSREKFYQDTLKSARDLARPDLIKVLTYNSADAVDWLQRKFKIDLSLVSRLGGHSYPRTHRGTEKFPGMTITYALMEELEELARKEPQRVVVRNKAKVIKLLRSKNNPNICDGCVYVKDNREVTEYGPVILATGGYAADFTENSLLRKHRPDFYDLPTTNGDHSTGDGIKMANEMDANLIDMEKVQVHPTGLIDPKEPNAKVKFLAAEALRGVGGLLINGEGKRFVDELQHRDFVTGQIWKTKLPIRLVLNTLAANEIEWHIKHYMGRGLMRKFNSGKDLAKEIGVSESVLNETFEDYNRAAKSKNDRFKKKFFHNAPFKMDDVFYVALMTPVLHFTMGGLEINENSQILNRNKAPIEGLFAAGEICGGVHGANRLGGSSLLGCVVYGRVAGASAARYQFQNLSQSNQQSSAALSRLNNINNHIANSNSAINASFSIDPAQNKAVLELNWDGSKHKTSQAQVGEYSAEQYNISQIQQNEPYTNESQALTQVKENKESEARNKQQEQKQYTYEEVAKHNNENDCWVVVNNQVLDVTSFMHEHPGGKKAIMLYAGKEASEEFNMLHKKDVVEKYAPETIKGFINKTN